MKSVRNVVRKIKVIVAQMQSRRVVLLVFGLIIGSLVVACGSASMPPAQSSNPPVASQANSATPAANQGSVVDQAQEPATEESQAEASATEESQDEESASEENQTEESTTEEDQAEASATEESQDEESASEEDQDEESASEENQTEESTAEEGQKNLPGTEEFGMTKEELVKSIEAVEPLIATCMSDAGFEYVPVDYATVREGMTADKSAPGLTSEEYAATYGYGISTQPPGGEASPAVIGLGEENMRIFNSLSPADQDAYNHTLFGENTDATFAVSLEAEDFSETGGCTRTAIEQVFSPEELSAAYYNPGDALIEQDPRVIAAYKAWSDCMREAGFDYNTPEETEPDVKERLKGILSGADPETLSAPAQAALTELQGEERAIAVADLECAAEFVEPVVEQVEAELYGAPQQ